VQAVWLAVGDDIDIMLDVNGGYSRRTALYMARAFAELGVYWVEEPLPHTDLDGLAELANHVDIPLLVAKIYILLMGLNRH